MIRAVSIILGLMGATSLALASTQPTPDAVFEFAKERCVDPMSTGMPPILSGLRSPHDIPDPDVFAEGRWFDTFPKLISDGFYIDTKETKGLRGCFVWISGADSHLDGTLLDIVDAFAKWRQETNNFETVPPCQATADTEVLVARGHEPVRGDKILRVVASHFVEQKWLAIIAAEVPADAEPACQ